MRIQLDPAPGIQFIAVGNVSTTVGAIANTTIIHPSMTGEGGDEEKGSSSAVAAALILVSISDAAISRMSHVSLALLTVSLDVRSAGPCVPAGHRDHLVVSWGIEPLLPPTMTMVATRTTFRSAAVASGLLGNPLAAMTSTAMISILSLDECSFSDVDPLDTSISPIVVAIG